MTQTNVNIRMDEDLKREFDSLCKDLGMSMTTAFTIFAKAAVRKQGIPFEITRNIPSAETIAAIEEAEAMAKDPSLGKAYTDIDVMIAELRS